MFMTTDISEEASELELKAGDKSIRAKSKYAAELIAFASIVLLTLALYGGYLHIQDTKEANAKIVQTLEKINDSTTAQSSKTVSAIKEQTCILSLSEAERKNEYQAPWGFCKRMSQ